MSKTFYVSTPIYYPSAKLHIGHAYTTIIADFLKRYKKSMGYKTFFVTGADQHGQKIEEYALKNNMSPADFVKKNTDSFKELWKQLNIKYDAFCETNSEKHIKTCQTIYKKIKANDDIYFDKYKGYYCVSCEEYLTKTQFKDQTCLVCGHKIKLMEEESYFFKVSKYQKTIENIFNNTDIVYPEKIKKEINNNFIKPGLKDLSISRKNVKWGISIEKDHVLYVWFDALSNYISMLDYPNSDKMKEFWNDNTEIVHIIGKEIARFHTVYWPSMLTSLSLRQPTKIIAHDWILFQNNKMSKSSNNVVDPMLIIKYFSSDVLRFYLLNNINLKSGGIYTNSDFIEFYNSIVVNKICNLISRTNAMLIKYDYIKNDDKNTFNNDFIDQIKNALFSYKKSLDNYDVNKATKIVIALSEYANKFIEEQKPWELVKKNKLDELNIILNTLLYNNIVISFLLSHFLDEIPTKISQSLGFDLKEINWTNIENTNILKIVKEINKVNIMQRLNTKEALELIEKVING